MLMQNLFNVMRNTVMLASLLLAGVFLFFGDNFRNEIEQWAALDGGDINALGIDPVTTSSVRGEIKYTGYGNNLRVNDGNDGASGGFPLDRDADLVAEALLKKISTKLDLKCLDQGGEL